MGISYSSFNKSQAGELPGTTEKHTQNQYSLDLMAGINDQVMLTATIPYVTKSLSVTGDSPINTRGIGDIDLGATYQFKAGVKDKVLFGTLVDVKLPTGRNALSDGSGRMDEHTQLGTGSTDLSVGFLATTEDHQKNLWFAGLRGRWNGRNGTGYHYGNAAFYNVGVSKDLNSASSLVLELNGRLAAHDRTDTGDLDPDSGGHFGYLSVSYRREMGPQTGLIASYQIPVIHRLNGTQSESGLLTFGIFTKF